MSARDLLDDAALVDDEDDESFDEETGEVRPRTNGTSGRFDDSSEEDEDDDEEEAAKVSTTGSDNREQPLVNLYNPSGS
jgi:transcription elongation factor SPT6